MGSRTLLLCHACPCQFSHTVLYRLDTVHTRTHTPVRAWARGRWTHTAPGSLCPHLTLLASIWHTLHTFIQLHAHWLPHTRAPAAHPTACHTTSHTCSSMCHCLHTRGYHTHTLPCHTHLPFGWFCPHVLPCATPLHLKHATLRACYLPPLPAALGSAVNRRLVLGPCLPLVRSYTCLRLPSHLGLGLVSFQLLFLAVSWVLVLPFWLHLGSI